MIGKYQVSTAKLPTQFGDFTIRCYRDDSGKEHVALYAGSLNGGEDIFTRIHSECFTGDVLGSHRCDCGTQLQASLRRIAEEKSGLLIYLRQEGRGIGLLNKIRAYDLQETKYLDTVDSNLALGFGEDERTYEAAIFMLQDLGVRSIRLNSNNPAKKNALEAQGIRISAIIPSKPVLTSANRSYLMTKAERMNHQIDPSWLGIAMSPRIPDVAAGAFPKVTLSYAQSLDGSIAASNRDRLTLSCNESMAFVHRLRANHDAILVGIDTVISDDPRLTVRLVCGHSPQPVVLDCRLRIPLGSKLFSGPKAPWIFTAPDHAPERRAAIEERGGKVFVVERTDFDRLDLPQLLTALYSQGIGSLLVEGGRTVITHFLNHHPVDQIHVTISPQFVGGLNVLGGAIPMAVQIDDAIPQMIGRDIVISGRPRRPVC